MVDGGWCVSNFSDHLRFRDMQSHANLSFVFSLHLCNILSERRSALSDTQTTRSGLKTQGEAKLFELASLNVFLEIECNIAFQTTNILGEIQSKRLLNFKWNGVFERKCCGTNSVFH